MQAARIDFVVETFTSALDWDKPKPAESELTKSEPPEPEPPEPKPPEPEPPKPEPVRKTKAIEIVEEQRENVIKPQPQSQPRRESNYTNTLRNDTDKIFTTKGRLNRKAYFMHTLKLIGLMIVGAILAQFLIGVPILIATWVGSYMISIRRLHDLNKSGWWVLLYLIPYVNLIFGLYLLFAPGTHGYNRYGEDPLAE